MQLSHKIFGAILSSASAFVKRPLPVTSKIGNESLVFFFCSVLSVSTSINSLAYILKED